jgi:hypothetical protein
MGRDSFTVLDTVVAIQPPFVGLLPLVSYSTKLSERRES